MDVVVGSGARPHGGRQNRPTATQLFLARLSVLHEPDVGEPLGLEPRTLAIKSVLLE